MSKGKIAPPNCPIIINIEILFFRSGYLTIACDTITGNKLALPTPIMAMNILRDSFVEAKYNPPTPINNSNTLI